MERNYGIENKNCCPCELARACVPSQVMGQVFSPREALQKGTLFPELYKPYNILDKNEMGCN